ncbi:MAG: hypothetical protein LBC41_12265 [Clostridiales bacterium]|jgi:hypothetical protein|nr:hypothetical protein [Clostridiales bacterium]
MSSICASSMLEKLLKRAALSRKALQDIADTDLIRRCPPKQAPLPKGGVTVAGSKA